MKDLILNDKHEIFNNYKSQCATCKRFDIFKYTCAAFPEGVPDSLLTGAITHLIPITGQSNNLVYINKYAE